MQVSIIPGPTKHMTPSPSGLDPVYKSSLRRVSTDTDTDDSQHSAACAIESNSTIRTDALPYPFQTQTPSYSCLSTLRRGYKSAHHPNDSAQLESRNRNRFIAPRLGARLGGSAVGRRLAENHLIEGASRPFRERGEPEELQVVEADDERRQQILLLQPGALAHVVGLE